MGNPLTELQREIIDTFKVEHKQLRITIIDTIKFYKDFLTEKKFFKILQKHKNSANKVDKYIIDKLLNPFYINFISLETYYENLLLALHFNLSNPFQIKDIVSDILYNNLEMLFEIPKLIKQLLEIQYTSPLTRKFQNNYLFERWKESLSFEKISFDVYDINCPNDINKKENYSKYLKVWCVFEILVGELKEIVDEYHLKYMNDKHIPGCINTSPEFYAYCCEMNVGLPFGKDGISFSKLIKWGGDEVEKIKKDTELIINELEPELSQLNYHSKITKINDMKTYKYKTKKDYIDDHKKKMKEYRDYFIEKKKLPLKQEPLFIDFDQKNMSAAYWFNNIFYLNTDRWQDTNIFDTSALVLHETIPGHHLQISWDLENDLNNSLSIWFPEITNGYAEGWGLFSERLCPDCDDYMRMGANRFVMLLRMGANSFAMLRSLRIVADVSMHYYGIDPEVIIQLFKRFLPMPEDSIRSEVYRYICLPGQAICYKLGDYILCKLFKQKLGRKLERLLDDDAIKLYDTLIKDGLTPLKILCDKYNIQY